MDFVALDFETATDERASACAVGLAFVEGGQLADTRSWLVRPPGNQYSSYNISIHGIRPEDTADKPNFGELWPTLQSILADRLVVAHYASFDMSVLRHTLDLYGVRHPDLEYLCTWVISRQVWPDWVAYKLDWVADQLGLEFQHHVAEEDAKVAAQVALRCAEELGEPNLRSVADAANVTVGRLQPDGYRPCGHRSDWSVAEIAPDSEDFDEAHSFYEKTVVFTGSLESMVRKEAMQKVVNCGGECTTSVSGNTDFLVVGDQDFSQFREGQTKSRKMQDAERLAAEGSGIEILAEEDFLRMLGGTGSDELN